MRPSAGKVKQATEALELDGEVLTEDSITRSYRHHAKTCHPDSGSYDVKRWHEISWAKDLLLEALSYKDAPGGGQVAVKGECRACCGTGRVRTGRGFSKMTMQCVMCGGTGRPKTHDRED